MMLINKKEMNLNLRQGIIDSLIDDSKSIIQIKEYLNYLKIPFNDNQIENEINYLFESKLISIIYPENIKKICNNEIENYWFELTELGYKEYMNEEKIKINRKIIDSKNELMEKIDKNLILGLESENPREFYLITILNLYINESFKCGLVSQSENIEPKIIIDKESENIFIGYNNKIAILKFQELKNVKEITLNSFFVDFVKIDKENLLIINEIGLQLINYKGEINWELDTDLITNYFIKDNVIYLDFLDSKSTCINLLSIV